eukprot:scaffold87606_cov62-Phaeocystis_antarctica.AAC.3
MQERRCDRGRWSMPQSPCSGSPRPGPLVAVPLGVRKRGLAVTRDHARSGPVQRLVERCRCQEGHVATIDRRIAIVVTTVTPRGEGNTGRAALDPPVLQSNAFSKAKRRTS